LLQTAEKMPSAFERKFLRKTYGPLLVNGRWQNRYKHDIYKLKREMEQTKNVRLSRP
jgi:hypothetical protein